MGFYFWIHNGVDSPVPVKEEESFGALRVAYLLGVVGGGRGHAEVRAVFTRRGSGSSEC